MVNKTGRVTRGRKKTLEREEATSDVRDPLEELEQIMEDNPMSPVASASGPWGNDYSNSPSVERLKMERACNKEIVETHIKRLEEATSSETPKIYLIKTLIENIEEYRTQITDASGQIQHTLNELAFSKDKKEFGEWNITIGTVVNEAKNLLKDHTKKDEALNTTPPIVPQKSNHKIPRLQLPRFGGNKMEYHGFIKSFRRAVEHEGCSKLDCLQHLKNSLDGRPLRDIITFGSDEKDYDSALQLLDTNYGDENMVIREILKALFQLQPPTYTHDSLALFRTEVLTHLRSLENFDLFPENCASCNQVLGFVLKDKFPEELRKETSRKHAEERPKDRYNKQMALESLNVTIDTLSDRTTTGSLVQPPTPSVRPKEKAAMPKSTIAAVMEQPQPHQQSRQISYQNNEPSRKKKNNNFYQQRTQFAPY